MPEPVISLLTYWVGEYMKRRSTHSHPYRAKMSVTAKLFKLYVEYRRTLDKKWAEYEELDDALVDLAWCREVTLATV